MFLHDRLPQDTGVHDGLQLVDEGAPKRYDTTPAPVPVVGTTAEASNDAAAAAAPVVGASDAPRAPPPGPVIPGPPAPLRLAPLPAHLPVLPGSQASREAARVGVRETERDEDWDEEEDEEIRPVSDERAAQWRAYRASGLGDVAVLHSPADQAFSRLRGLCLLALARTLGTCMVLALSLYRH